MFYFKDTTKNLHVCPIKKKFSVVGGGGENYSGEEHVKACKSRKDHVLSAPARANICDKLSFIT